MAVPVWVAGQVLTAADVNTWFVPRAVRKTSLTSRVSTTTLADDPDLTLPVDSNASYELDLRAEYDATTTADLLWQITGPSGAGCMLVFTGPAPSAITAQDVWTGTRSAVPTSGNQFGGLGAGVNAAMLVSGHFWTSATAGNVTFQWAQQTSSGTATIVHAGSSLTLRRVG